MFASTTTTPLCSAPIVPLFIGANLLCHLHAVWIVVHERTRCMDSRLRDWTSKETLSSFCSLWLATFTARTNAQETDFLHRNQKLPIAAQYIIDMYDAVTCFIYAVSTGCTIYKTIGHSANCISMGTDFRIQLSKHQNIICIGTASVQNTFNS